MRRSKSGIAGKRSAGSPALPLRGAGVPPRLDGEQSREESAAPSLPVCVQCTLTLLRFTPNPQ